MTVLEPEILPATPRPAQPRYAGLATRVLAFAADVAVINVVGWFVAGIIALALSVFNLPQEVKTVLVTIGSLIGLVWAWGYFTFFWSTTGQTPGNRLLAIRVLDARTLSPPSPHRAGRRVLALFVAAIPFCLGFFWILLDDRRRGWHDKLARTIVVDATGEPTPIVSDARPVRRRVR
jgi:uncharacterized RDD family membrane protein YckC